MFALGLGLLTLGISALDFLFTTFGRPPSGDMVFGPFFLHVPLALAAIVLSVLAGLDIRRRGLRGRYQALAGGLAAILAIGMIPITGKVEDSRRSWAWGHRNQVQALGLVRLIRTAEVTYSTVYPKVGFSPDLHSLAGKVPCQPGHEHACLVEEVQASGETYGYRFTYASSDTNNDGVGDAFRLQADPVFDPTQSHFFLDQTGVIRYDEEHPATAASPPLQ